ncbi:MAG: DUF2497 domain-containing protein [Rhodobiaceae bacterium]|nr:DUF2497 domain-containing protein [Rhodobiaceae bacterium]MCC0047958.1 DUF2497 domain-containing protein [Rhodobiaceae bacterium]
MSKAAQQSEPSMEEILASIRKIISDENDAPAPEAAKPAEKPAPEPAPEAEQKPEPAEAKAPAEPEPAAAEDTGSDDIFELTDDMVAYSPKMVEPVEPEVSFGDFAEEESTPAPQAVAKEAVKPGASSAASIADRLISPATDAAVGSAFGKLANTILSRDSHTLEDLVKEMLRPMLQEWLDDNLPNMVEKLVREEIERVSRGR